MDLTDTSSDSSANCKPTNPKDACGVMRAPMHYVPCEVVMEIGLALLEGSLKYGAHNWRTAGVRSSVYFDACHRHLAQFWEGEDIDQDSGLHHITKAIACLVVLRDAMFVGKCLDDRPPKIEDGWAAKMNAAAKSLIARYPNKPEAVSNRLVPEEEIDQLMIEDIARIRKATK